MAARHTASGKELVCLVKTNKHALGGAAYRNRLLAWYVHVRQSDPLQPSVNNALAETVVGFVPFDELVLPRPP